MGLEQGEFWRCVFSVYVGMDSKGGFTFTSKEKVKGLFSMVRILPLENACDCVCPANLHKGYHFSEITCNDGFFACF